MSHSFSEIWTALPKGRRGHNMKVAIALYDLNATSIERAVPVAKVKDLLKVKCRCKMPSNIADTLRKAGSIVEPHAGPSGRVWWLTQSGIATLETQSKLQLRPDAFSDHRYGTETLHPLIRQSSETLIQSQHFSEAVGRAVKELNFMVRKRTSRSSDDGVKMMMHVFSPDPNGHKRLVLGSLRHEWERDRQEGFRFMMAGVQQGIANVDKHGRLGVSSTAAALEMLAFLSFLARQVDAAIEVKEPAAVPT